MKVNCLFIDDEPLALDVLDTYAKQVDSLHIVGSCNDAIEASRLLQKHKVDLLFLDIQMPQLNGLEFLNTLRKPPKIVFTTAYRDYAIKAFELDAIDYLLKPISFERFLKAVNKVYQIIYPNISDFRASAPGEAACNGVGKLGFMYVRADRKMVKVFLKEVLYIESLKDYVSIFTMSGRIITKQKISYLDERLPEDMFLRIHRSYLIAIDKIEAFNSHSVEIDKKELPIGRSYRSKINKFLQGMKPAI